MHKLICEMSAAPGALERFLRIVRVKGFTIDCMEVVLENAKFEIKLQLRGKQTASQLVVQLRKLQDVSCISVMTKGDWRTVRQGT